MTALLLLDSAIDRPSLRLIHGLGSLGFLGRLKQLCYLLLMLWAAYGQSALMAQVAPAATRGNNAQIGGSFSFAQSDFGAEKLNGFGVYATYDFRAHWGVEAELHQVFDSNFKIDIFEKSYEVGPHYSLHFGRWQPYGKFMFGRGVFQFPPDPLHPAAGPVANLAYNMFAGGFGADYRLKPHINLRADYELQRWIGFPPNGLSPRVFSVGVAFHFR